MPALTQVKFSILTLCIVFGAQQALSQHLRLDCEVRQYGEYSAGEARKVAESWIPSTSTHIINNRKSYHVEYNAYGSARHGSNRIYFNYPSLSEEDLGRNIKYTYLTKKNLFIGVVHFGPNLYSLHTRGKCTAQILPQDEAARFFR